MSNRSRKKQKKTDFIFTDDKIFYSLSKIFAILIPAEIVYKDNIDSLTKEAVKLVKEKKDKDRNLVP